MSKIKSELSSAAYSSMDNEAKSVTRNVFFDTSKQIDVVLLGDSITEALDEKEISTKMYIINSGVSGDKTNYMKRRFERDVLDKRPRMTHILGGVNDLHHWQDGTYYQGMTQSQVVDTIYNNIVEMADRSLEAGVHVLLGTILPVARPETRQIDNQLMNKMIQSINDKLCLYGAENGLSIIDYYQSFIADGMLDLAYSEDGLHLNNKGNKKMIDLIRFELGISE